MKVLTIEQMNKLKELGVDVSNASVRVGKMVFYHADSWYGVDSYNVHLLKNDDDDTSCFEEEYKAFTLQDIIELLPKQLPCDDFGFNCLLITPNLGLTGYVFHYTDNADGEIYKQIYSEDILQSAYEMLIWVIEKGCLKTK